jgi:Na+-driven multidrug efflux pump
MEKTTTEGIATKKILTIAIPLILQQLSLQMQLWVDRAMLGHVDTRYFSAVGNAIVPYHAITAIIFAVCTGTTILIAQSIGSGNL